MAQLNKQFIPGEHEPMVDYSPLPAGEYIARITKSEMKPTKNNLGKYLELEFTVDSPGYQGRKVWARLNLVNQNANAVQIAERELKSVCDAVGSGPIMDTNVLHGKPMIVKLKVDPASAQYSESNSILAYKSMGTSGVQQTVPGMEQPQGFQPPAGFVQQQQPAQNQVQEQPTQQNQVQQGQQTEQVQQQVQGQQVQQTEQVQGQQQVATTQDKPSWAG